MMKIISLRYTCNIFCYLILQIDLGMIKCDECGYRATVLSKILIHKQIHGVEKPYICDICNKVSCIPYTQEVFISINFSPFLPVEVANFKTSEFHSIFILYML